MNTDSPEYNPELEHPEEGEAYLQPAIPVKQPADIPGTGKEDDRRFSYNQVVWIVSKMVCEHAPRHSQFESASTFVDNAIKHDLFPKSHPAPSPSTIEADQAVMKKLDSVLSQMILDREIQPEDAKEILNRMWESTPSSTSGSIEQDDELWSDMLNFFQGEYVLNNNTTKEEVIRELKQSYTITRR